MTSAIDLRCGDWREALADVGEVDALITDPPYSERTHAGMKLGEREVTSRLRDGRFQYKHFRGGVQFAHWSPDEVVAFVKAWSPRVRGWIVVMTDDVLAPVLQQAAADNGRYAFAPLPFVEVGKQPRLSGDGPASWTCWIMVSRPRARRFQSWGSLAGAYVTTSQPSWIERRDCAERVIKGAKPLWLMRALVRDYTRPGDLVCDPCAGGATTLLAAAIEGRRAVGAELDPSTHAKALRRIARGYTPDLFTSTSGGSGGSGMQPTAAAQAELFGAGDVACASDKPSQR